MKTFQELIEDPSSEKIVIAIAEAVDQFKIFESLGGGIYVRDVEHFVSSVRQGSIDLAPSDSSDLSPGSFYFSVTNKELYVRMTDDSNPKTKSISAKYKFFFSNVPLILPWDLENGEEVEFQARIPDGGVGALGQQLDDQNTGIVLESSSQLSLINSDGYFDEIFDTLIWDNQTIEFYQWFQDIELSQKRKVFKGVVDSKEFASDKIVLKVKDFVYQLRNQVSLPVFTTADGTIPDSVLGTPKRRLYGQFKQLKTVGIDNVLSGYALLGFVTVANESTDLVGTGTNFLKELAPGDEVFIPQPGGDLAKLSIESITSDNLAVLSKAADFNASNVAAKVKPSLPYRFKNRRWHIAGHKLRSPQPKITYPLSSRRFQVNDTSDLFPGDNLQIGDSIIRLLRVSGNEIVLTQAAFPVPHSGQTIVRNPVTKVYYGSKELIADRDFTIINNNDDAIVVLNEFAEFNIANQRKANFTFNFVNGSKNVTTSAENLDLGTLIEPRDWIKKNDLADSNWYEVMSVGSGSFELREAYSGATQDTTMLYKNVEVLEDDSLITVDCMGIEDNEGKWVKTPSDVVKHLLLNDAKFDSLNEEAFAQARSDCGYIMSLPIPQSVGDSAPSIRDTISLVNTSCFGSLYGDGSQEISFSVMNARKPLDMKTYRDDDIISWSSSTEQQIVNKVVIKYRPFVDIYTGEDTFENLEFLSTFVDELVGIKNTEERIVYLYEESKARTVSHRVALSKTLSNCKIVLKGKMLFSLTSVNDKIIIELSRLFKRYGGRDPRKIVTVSGIKNNSSDVDLEVTDLGNLFNRVPVIAPNDTPKYPEATRDQIMRYGFILDNNTLTPDNLSEAELGNNRIG